MKTLITRNPLGRWMCMLMASLLLCVLTIQGQSLAQMRLVPIDLSETIPDNDITALYQDHDGFVWIGTSNGLYRYDGRHVQCYRNTLLFPHLLPSNEITCMLDDGNNRLWIGTRQGVCRMNLKDGSTQSYDFKDFANSNIVKCMLFTRDETLWIGSEGGLYRYQPKDDTFVLQCSERGNAKVPQASITTLFEDHKGYVWIGTWDHGLYRYNPSDKSFYAMPSFNPQQSAHVVYESNGVLWVGTWGSGLYKISNPYDTNKPLRLTQYTLVNTNGRLQSNIIWDINRDQNTGLLWVGTNEGLTLVENADQPHSNLLALPASLNPEPDYFGRGASCFLCDRDNQMWAVAGQHGMVLAQTNPLFFSQRLLPPRYLYNDVITCLEVMPNGNVWVGLRRKGLLVYPDNKKDNYSLVSLPSSASFIKPLTANAALVGTEFAGLYVVENGKITRQFNKDNCPFIKTDNIYCLAFDKHSNWLIGTYQGLSVRFANGKGVHVEGKQLGLLANSDIRSITSAADGTIWLGTRKNGLLRLRGDLSKPNDMTLRQYTRLADTELELRNVFKLLVDRCGRLWACTKEAGLLVYDAKSDMFVSASSRFGIPDKEVYSIEESANGNLWIAMRNELICLSFDADGMVGGMRTYQRRMVIGSQYFGYGQSSANNADGIAFGFNTGFVSFPDLLPASESNPFRPMITDILVDGMPISLMKEDERNDVSPLLPPYTETLTLAPMQRELTLRYSSFNYNSETCPRFSYRLEGYDDDWMYPDASQSEVVYSNLTPGSYTFRLRHTDASGNWSADEQVIHIHVLAPFYLRWYAWVVYVILMGCAIYMVVRYFKNKEEVNRQLQLAHMERHNIEQLNHKKLQFFTNITHDLMTPLTIISATISQLVQTYPEAKDDCRTINSNVNRLMRLLQQILEFRKTETGNQHLRVSQGSVSDFVRNEVESIMPITYKKNIRLSVNCQPEHIVGYFDCDKLDKILYNLISNATKYNREDGHIEVSLTCDDGQWAIIRVKDDGAGIAADKLPSLFQRFYEGEHRRFNTYGMGIGLSLVKDLVTLHHGTVAVESELGKGSTFTVTLPINRDAFAEEEIEDSMQMMVANMSTTADTKPVRPANKQAPTILVVEDNEELLLLLKRLLEPNYQVLTAYNGREAIEVADNEKVDLILTDVMMPVMDGIEMTRELRNRPDAPNCPIIMLTAKHDDEARAEAYQAGADAYITKPFNTSVLQVRIKNLLQHKEKADKEISDKLFGGIKDVKIAGSDQEFLNKCIEMVQQHLDNADFDLPTFAELMNTSKSTLYKKLRMITGLSTSAFIRSIRMKSAIELLRKNPNAHVSDIAYAVGYNDPKYFSSCFKKDFGCLPTEYAKREASASSQGETEDAPSKA